MNKAQIKILVLALISLGLAGCEVQQAVAPNVDQVQATELKDFDPKDARLNLTNLRLVNNKFFLWREGMTPSDVTTALQISRKLDELDDEAFPLNRKQLQFEIEVDSLKKELKEIQTRIKGLNEDLKRANKEKADEEAKPEEERNQARLLELAQEISRIEAELPQKKAQEAEMKSAVKSTQRELSKVNAVLRPIEDEGTAQVNRLMEIVDWYKDQPSSVAFTFKEDGTISAELRGWNLGDDEGQRNFSTDRERTPINMIEDVAYRIRGGVFTFKAVVYTDETQREARETYCFKIARAKYDVTDRDGRIFFAGDIVREFGVTSCDSAVLKKSKTIRKGSAKLVDRNN
jgi:hypothetical protein